MNSVFWGVAAYVAVQFAIGIWVSRRIKSSSDFVLAGRSLGVGLLAFTVFGSFFGAEAIVGTAGSVYESGLSGAQIDPLGYGLAIFAVAMIVAIPLWKRGLFTFADFFRERYSPVVEKVVVLVLLPGSIFWAAAQIRAFGNILGHTAGLDVTLAIAFSTMLVVAYSALGGLLADAWTDLVQGACIVLGLVVLAIVVAGHVGGVSGLAAAVEPERVRPMALGDAGVLGLIERLAIPICGTLVAVEIISRVLGARSAEVARNGALIGAGLYLSVGLIPVFLGMAGAVLMPGLDTPEQIIPKLAEKYLHGVLYVMFAGAIVSAILSTVDTILLASAAQVAHNILGPLAPVQTEQSRLLVIRLTVVGLAIVAFTLAMSFESVKQMTEMASAAGSSGVFVALIFGLFTTFGGPLAALASILTGATSWALLALIWEASAPYTSSLILAGLAYIGAAYAEPRIAS